MGFLILVTWLFTSDRAALGVQFDVQELENQRQTQRWFELEAKGPIARTPQETKEYWQMRVAAGNSRPTQSLSLGGARTPASLASPRKLLNLRDGAVDLELENLADQGQATWLNPRSEDTGPIGMKYRAKE